MDNQLGLHGKRNLMSVNKSPFVLKISHGRSQLTELSRGQTLAPDTRSPPGRLALKITTCFSSTGPYDIPGLVFPK